MPFSGSDYDAKFDVERLTSQLARIARLMLDGVWRTLPDIANATGAPPASVSAQLRNLRKAEFGSFILEKRLRGDRKNGLYEYRILRPEKQAESAASKVEDVFYDALKRKVKPVREFYIVYYTLDGRQKVGVRTTHEKACQVSGMTEVVHVREVTGR